MFNAIKNLINLEKIIEAKVENKVADTVKNQVAEQLNIKTDQSKQFNVLNQNIVNVVGYDLKQELTTGLQNGNTNNKLLGQDVQKLLIDNNISPEDIKEKLKDPEVILAITDAAKSSYIESNPKKRQTLANLVYKKFTNEDNFESIILSQAIKIIGTLTEEQLKCISLIFLLKSKYVANNIKVDELNTFFEDYIMQLIDINEELWFPVGMGIYSSGCAVTFTFGNGVYNFFPKIDNTKPTDELLKEKINNYKRLKDFWVTSRCNASHLTPVGECLAHSYLHLKTGIIINWLK